MRKEFVLHSQQLQCFCWTKQHVLDINHKYSSLNFYPVSFPYFYTFSAPWSDCECVSSWKNGFSLCPYLWLMVHVEWESLGEAMDYGNTYSTAPRWEGLVYHCSARATHTRSAWTNDAWPLPAKERDKSTRKTESLWYESQT